jgi:hypothetical protein
MTEIALIGVLAGLVILVTRIPKRVSRLLNRRLARKLAKGPVGTLMRHNYDYAMELSAAVFQGEKSLEQAKKHAETWIHLNVATGSQQKLRMD